ncbi:MAG: hypothetical protein KGN01_04790 [Patescibacteria group bacterium]|nr:hypothetical protein [Patescibacteria group bacterium]
MKNVKILLPSLILAFATPITVHAAWWNPLTWFQSSNDAIIQPLRPLPGPPPEFHTPILHN